MRAVLLLVTVAALALPSAALAAPPSCSPPGEQQVRESRALSVPLGASCSDPDGDDLTYAIVTQPAHAAMLTPDEVDAVRYEPAAGFTGLDSFAFTARDAQDTAGPITVAIAVTANRSPSCTADAGFDVEPNPAPYREPIYVFEICSDPDFDTLQPTIVDPPKHGSVTAVEYGLLYEPVAGYSGPDAFTLRVSDDLHAESNLATVHITVLEPNRPPTCAPTVELRVAPGGSLPLDHRNACSDPDGDFLYPGLVSGPDHGDLNLLSDPISYIPHPGYVGLDQIVFFVQDDRGAESNVSTLTITVGLSPGPEPSPPTGDRPPRIGDAETGDRVAPRIGADAVAGQKIGRVRKRGLRVRLRSSEAADVTLRLTVDRRTARRLGLRATRAHVVIGTLKRSVPAGSTRLRIRLTAAARKATRSVRTLPVRLSTVAIDTAGNRREGKRHFTLGR